MKSTLYDSKKSIKKSDTAYASSYIDKYRRKTTKPSFQLDRLHMTQKNQHQNHQSYTSINRSLQNSYHSSVSKGQDTEAKMDDNQWIGAKISTSNKPKNRHTQNSLQSNPDISPILIESFPISQSVPKKPSNILIEEQIQQDLSIYQQYRILQEQYQQQLDKIKEETDRIQQECSLQRKRITESEQLLFLKKKKLRQLEESYDKIIVRNQAEKREEQAIINMYEQKLHKLRTQYDQVKLKHSQEMHKLQNELASTEIENKSLQNQLSELQAELQRYNVQQSQEISTLQELETQQDSLLQQIAALEKQQANLQREIQELQQQKNEPIPIETHKKYLEIYEKMFITNQLHKAQDILRMKDQEKHQMQEIQKRKSMIKDKKVEISLKEKRITEKNKMIDKLTQQIREKSTTLLNLYQQQ